MCFSVSVYERPNGKKVKMNRVCSAVLILIFKPKQHSTRFRHRKTHAATASVKLMV